MHITLQFYQQNCPSISISNLVLKRGFRIINSQHHPENKALAFSKIVFKTFLIYKSSMKKHNQLNPKEHIQALQIGEA